MPKSIRPVAPAMFRALLALASLLALFGFAAAPADAAPWGVPEEVSVPGGSASWSQVGTDAAGDATAVWTRSNGLNFVLQAAERPAGGGWTAPIDLSGAAGSAESPALAVDPAGDVAAAWKQRLSGSEAIEVAYKPAGGSWGAPEAVEFGAAVVETPAVAIDDAGDAVVVWRQGLGGNHIVSATSRPAGGSWAAPVALSNSALNAEAPDVAISPAGTADAVWQSSNGAFSLVESTILPLGGSWTGAEAISLPAAVTEPPHVVADATGDFFAIWSRSGTGLVAEVASRPAGGGWQAPEQISTPALEAHAPRLAVDSTGDAVAAWYRFDGSVGSVEGTSRTAGGSWSAPIRLSPLGAEAEAPQLAMSPSGVAQVVWSGWNEASHNYQLRADRRPPGAEWDGSVLVSRELEEAYGPHVAIDGSGDAIVVWNGEVEPDAEIMSSFRDETPPIVVPELEPTPTTGSGDSGLPKAPAGAPACVVAGAASSVGTFVPTAKPGDVVPGIRARVGVDGLSSVSVTGTLTYGAGKARRVGLGTVAYHADGLRNLRFALPASLRSALPLGSSARISLAVTAKPDSEQGCATPGAVTHKLKLKVVKVFAAGQAWTS